MSSPFASSFDALPESLAIFPLSSATLLPHARLHLNIFEPRYLNMTLDALGNSRMIGMIQPRSEAGFTSDPESDDPSGDDPQNNEHSGEEAEPIYDVGCAGRIVSFNESDDGRLIIALSGVIRFRVAVELPMSRGYRNIVPAWNEFQEDMVASDPAACARIDPTSTLSAARRYLNNHSLQANLDALASLDAEQLINALSIHLPFEPSQKQALIEIPTITERADLLNAMFEMDTGLEDDMPITRH